MIGHEGDEESSAPNQEDEITASQAMELLGILPARFAHLLNENVLPYRKSPLDKRVHLVRLSDVNTLLQESRGMTVEQARTQLVVSRQKMSALIVSGELPVRLNPLNAKQRLVDSEQFARLLSERQMQLKRSQRTTRGTPS